MNTSDTICAVCTGLGGAISILRVAGPEALKATQSVWRGTALLGKSNARKMLLGNILENGRCCENALAVYMPGPHSYTGDDVVELHTHGGAVSAKRAIRSLLASGFCRPAEPGEFTYRAFVNGKLDLTQAEAVGDLISAQTESALHLAERQLAGHLREKVTELRNTLTEIAAECESHLDFPDEVLDWTPDEKMLLQLGGVLDTVSELVDGAKNGMVLREGIRVVIAGRPNAGKSSLLNRILQTDRAIVTDIAGTTRDTLEEQAVIRGIPVRITDTAGIRKSDDTIETLGIDRSLQSIRNAQVVFWLLDASAPDLELELTELHQQQIDSDRIIVIWNKCDLPIVSSRKLPAIAGALMLSAKTGTGLDVLFDRFSEIVWNGKTSDEPDIAINERHLASLWEVKDFLPEAIHEIAAQRYELAAISLYGAISSLGEITGETVQPDVLDKIFSKFCIGK